MSMRRASILTIKSLSALSQVSSRPSLISSRKIIDNASSLFLRRQSSAAQRTDYPHVPHAAHDPRDAPNRPVPQPPANVRHGYHQNPSGFSREYPYQQSPSGLHHSPNERIVTGEFHQTADVRLGESTGIARYSQNRGGFYQEAPPHRESAMSFHPNPNFPSGHVGGGGSNGETNQHSGGLQGRNPGVQNKGVCYQDVPLQRRDRLYSEGPGDPLRSPHENTRSVTGEFHQTDERRHGEGTGNAGYDRNSGGFYQEVPRGFRRESAGGFHPNPDTSNTRYGGGFLNSSNGQYRNPNYTSGYIGRGGSNGGTDQHSGGLQRGNPGVFQQEYKGECFYNKMNRDVCYQDASSQRRDGLYSEGPADLHRSSRVNTRTVTGEFHQTGDGRHWESTGNARNNQNSGGFYQEPPAQRADGFHVESARCVHPNPDTNNMGNGGGFYSSQYGNQNVSSGYVHSGITNGEAHRHSGGGFQQQGNGSYGGYQVNAHQSAYGYTREKYTGESVNYTQTPNESNAHRPVEFQHHNSGFVDIGPLDSPSMHSTNTGIVLPTAKLSEYEETSSYEGTIEELDCLCKEGKIKEAVQVLSLLERRVVAIDRARYLGLLGLCGEARFLEEARVIHDHMSKVVIHLDVGLHNNILVMYSKCGSMSDAHKLFETMTDRNLTSWNAMIMGLANNGLGEEAIDLFNQFKETRLRPDGQIFVTVFSACAVLGAIDEGLLHFESMQKDFNIVPGMEHYVGIVDLLGKSGYLDEAVEFIEKMPIEPSLDIWETLMNTCRMNGNKKLGDRCAEIVKHMDPSRYTTHAKTGLLSVKASDLARDKEIKKANSFPRMTREYRAGDSDPEHAKCIKGLEPQMKEAGYVPQGQWTLHDVGEECREEALLYHSERMAIAYGLMTSPARSQVRIMKNLRVCGDCHNALKLISKIAGRTIIARDVKRFHHFVNGMCSCNDFW